MNNVFSAGTLITLGLGIIGSMIASYLYTRFQAFNKSQEETTEHVIRQMAGYEIVREARNLYGSSLRDSGLYALLMAIFLAVVLPYAHESRFVQYWLGSILVLALLASGFFFYSGLRQSQMLTKAYVLMADRWLAELKEESKK